MKTNEDIGNQEEAIMLKTYGSSQEEYQPRRQPSRPQYDDKAYDEYDDPPPRQISRTQYDDREYGDYHYSRRAPPLPQSYDSKSYQSTHYDEDDDYPQQRGFSNSQSYDSYPFQSYSPQSYTQNTPPPKKKSIIEHMYDHWLKPKPRDPNDRFKTIEEHMFEDMNRQVICYACKGPHYRYKHHRDEIDQECNHYENEEYMMQPYEEENMEDMKNEMLAKIEELKQEMANIREGWKQEYENVEEKESDGDVEIVWEEEKPCGDTIELACDVDNACVEMPSDEIGVKEHDNFCDEPYDDSFDHNCGDAYIENVFGNVDCVVDNVHANPLENVGDINAKCDDDICDNSSNACKNATYDLHDNALKYGNDFGVTNEVNCFNPYEFNDSDSFDSSDDDKNCFDNCENNSFNSTENDAIESCEDNVSNSYDSNSSNPHANNSFVSLDDNDGFEFFTFDDNALSNENVDDLHGMLFDDDMNVDASLCDLNDVEIVNFLDNCLDDALYIHDLIGKDRSEGVENENVKEEVEDKKKTRNESVREQVDEKVRNDEKEKIDKWLKAKRMIKGNILEEKQ
ncbi:uncharacterized protein LOC116019585 [Ipomoea triloba]|uniref:uncharacterized protein LOC116019585 n=1 Tax=Ipomoea triloba TaxID=35885 RepID=UPI00125D0C7D|nr:uncharacterized protein LOC116019585 [Ipomoea triloba]